MDVRIRMYVRTHRRTPEHVRTYGRALQLAGGLASPTGLDTVVFAKPDGRARIKSMERGRAALLCTKRSARAPVRACVTAGCCG